MSNGDICLKSANRLTDSIMHQNMAAINGSSLLLYRTFHRSFTLAASVTRKKSPNVYKSCPKMISLEK